MSSQTTLIKDRLSIVDVISSYIKLEQAGKNYKAKCPFHNEKTPSFFISPDRGSYYCFGCSAKGDIFSFVQNFEGIDFLGALKILAEKAGVKLEYSRDTQSKDERERYYQIMEEATVYFEKVFEHEKEPKTYLNDRGLKDETIKYFRIGYAPSSWRSVSEYLIKKGFKESDLEKVGLTKKGNSGFYDRFRARIIFPISDSSGRVIAFSGRIFYLSTDPKPEIEEAKYLNSPDSPLFNKSNTLFGIDKAKNAIRTRGYSIIVEGQMDLIMSHQSDFPNTVAVSGTALSDNTAGTELKINNLGLIRRISPNVIFAYDGDDAGIRAAGRSAMIAFSLEMQVKIAILPKGKDPADLILEDKEQWKQIIKNSVNIISFHLEKICDHTKDTRVRGRKVREVIFPYLLMIKSSIERSSYIKEIYSKTGIAEKAIIEDFEKYELENKDNKENKVIIEENNKPRRDILLHRLMGILFWQTDSSEPPNNVLEVFDNLSKSIGSEKFDELKSLYEPIKKTLSFESEMLYGGKEDIMIADLRELALNVEEELLKEKLLILLDEINSSGKSIPKESLALYQKTIEKIQEIKSRRESN